MAMKNWLPPILHGIALHQSLFIQSRTVGLGATTSTGHTHHAAIPTSCNSSSELRDAEKINRHASSK